jgi:hypothetical protein
MASWANGLVEASLICGESHERCEIDWRVDDSVQRSYFVELASSRGKISGSGPDLFEALGEVRRQLEAAGCLLAVQGSRLDAYPSGMARDMSGGEQVYVLTMGRPAEPSDLVDTLAESDPGHLATVDDRSASSTNG